MTTHASTPDERLLASWDANASAWTAAVREHRIPSRRAGTDAAILNACTRLASLSVLDVGCGEGWLARALADSGRRVVGIDASAELIAQARAHDVSEGRARYETVSYEQLIADATSAAGPFELIVCNFALLGDPLVPLLSALASRLAPAGQLLIQTVHPVMAVGEGAYVNGWREETFQGFGVSFPAAMPWYFRTLGSWVTELDGAGLRITALGEPMHPDSARPLSLLLHCAADVGQSIVRRE